MAANIMYITTSCMHACIQDAVHIILPVSEFLEWFVNTVVGILMCL